MHQHSNLWIPEEEERKKRYEKIFEKIMVENFPNMEKEIVNEIQEAQESHTGQTQGETHQETY